MEKGKSVAVPAAQTDLFSDRSRRSMTWSQIPDSARARVLERVAQLLLASNDGPNNDGDDDE
jgi:hypothetical protein